MECLSCGDCCLRMSPLSEPNEPCENVVKVNENTYLCKTYKNRPEQCKKYEFPMKYCHIGMEKLKITLPHVLQRRLDDIWETKNKFKNMEVSHNGIGAVC